jgi:2-methylcitrate dehydratase PrpD
MHPALTALDKLLRATRIDVADITRIVVQSNPLAHSSRFTAPSPQTFAGLQFSYPHVVAMMLLGVDPGPDWLDLAFSRSGEVEFVKAKVVVEVHPRSHEFQRSFVGNQMRKMPGGIRIELGDQVLEAESEFAAGDPWTADTHFSVEHVSAKFRRLVQHPRREEALKALLSLDRQQSLEPVYEIIRGPLH